MITGLLLLQACGQEQPKSAVGDGDREVERVSLESLEARASYVIGADIAQQLEDAGVQLDVAAASLGAEDLLAQRELRLTPEKVRETMEELRLVSQEARRQELQQVAEDNKNQAEEFFSTNAKLDGVVTLDSGLQYKELSAGSGVSPGPDDVVTVHYRGRLIDGTVFDSSYSRNQPSVFPVSQVIAGWTEALQMMQEGDKWELYIPSNLAYGEKGDGKIEPYATLLFYVELIKVNPVELPQSG